MLVDRSVEIKKDGTDLGAKKRRVVAVATTPYQLLVFLFLKDAFLSDTSVDIILTDKTPLLEDLFKSRKLEAYFDNVLFADGRKIKNPYKSALQVLFESLIYNPTTKKIMTGSLGVYDECFYAAPGMPDEIIKEISKTLIKENRDIVFHRFEDGFSSYTVKAEHIISTGSGRDVYKRFLKYDITEKEKDAYLFCPALAESDIGLDLVTIPKDDDRIRRVSEICRNIFDIESKVPDEGVIFLGAGTLHETSDPERYKEIVRQLAQAAGEGNFVMKPHPRAIYDDIDGIPLYGSDAPFELSMMGGGFEEKTLVSFYSTACITVKLLFNSKCRVIFLYPMSDECFNETLRFDHFFNEAARIFDNIHIAHNLDEAKKLLSEAG